MIDTAAIRARLDGLCAADGADTYWRDRMLDALHDIDVLEAQVSNRDSALEAAHLRITDLSAELENRKQQFDDYIAAEEINNAGLEQEITTLQQANKKLTADSEMHRKANESLSAALKNVTLQMRHVEEKEAACCPEDIGFDEYIRSLTKELDELRGYLRRYETVSCLGLSAQDYAKVITKKITLMNPQSPEAAEVVYAEIIQAALNAQRDQRIDEERALDHDLEQVVL